VMIVTIHKVNEYSESVAALGRIDPVLALWGPFALFAALVFWMFYQIAYVPGGQPIGAIDRVAAKLGKAIGKLLPGRRKVRA